MPAFLSDAAALVVGVGMTTQNLMIAHMIDNLFDALDLLSGAEREPDRGFWYGVSVGLWGATLPCAVSFASTWRHNTDGARPPRWAPEWLDQYDENWEPDPGDDPDDLPIGLRGGAARVCALRCADLKRKAPPSGHRFILRQERAKDA